MYAIRSYYAHQALALDSGNGKRPAGVDLARVLAQLSVSGYAVNLSRWDDRPEEIQEDKTGKKPGVKMSLTGANYFKRPPKRPAKTPQAIPPAASPATPAVAQKPAASVAPAAAPTPPQIPAGALQEALRLTQQSMQALQSLQEQTARLHQQFLEGQEQATRSFTALIEQQRRMLMGTATAVDAPLLV